MCSLELSRYAAYFYKTECHIITLQSTITAEPVIGSVIDTASLPICMQLLFLLRYRYHVLRLPFVQTDTHLFCVCVSGTERSATSVEDCSWCPLSLCGLVIGLLPIQPHYLRVDHDFFDVLYNLIKNYLDTSLETDVLYFILSAQYFLEFRFWLRTRSTLHFGLLNFNCLFRISSIAHN